MANDEHVEILRQGVEVWNAWRYGNLHLDVCIDLRDADLGGQDLSGTFLRGADLSGAHLVCANLANASLEKANLSRSNLSHAYLEEVDLRGADLSDAIMDGAALNRANLSGAKLSRAWLLQVNLKGANLKGANLTESTLRSVEFIGTEMEQANLSGASVGNSTFADLDLSSVQGLETVQHVGPSSLGIDTLHCSQGQIPIVFLRGCGVPESFITAASLTPTAVEGYRCFICYGLTESDFAHQLHDYLQRHGIRCWLHEHQPLREKQQLILGGADYRRGDKILLCASVNSLNTWWAEDTINWAFGMEMMLRDDWVTNEMERMGSISQNLITEWENQISALIPLDLDGAIYNDGFHLYETEPIDAEGVIEKVRSCRIVDFVGWETDKEKMGQGLESVLQVLRTDGGREEPSKSLL